jgi:predicted nucleic acid-binding protein
VNVWFSWRPVSQDPGDDHVIDCAMNARAAVVTSNVRDFKEAVRTLGLKVVTPVKFLELLTNRER